MKRNLSEFSNGSQALYREVSAASQGPDLVYQQNNKTQQDIFAHPHHDETYSPSNGVTFPLSYLNSSNISAAGRSLLTHLSPQSSSKRIKMESSLASQQSFSLNLSSDSIIVNNTIRASNMNNKVAEKSMEDTRTINKTNQPESDSINELQQCSKIFVELCRQAYPKEKEQGVKAWFMEASKGLTPMDLSHKVWGAKLSCNVKEYIKSRLVRYLPLGASKAAETVFRNGLEWREETLRRTALVDELLLNMKQTLAKERIVMPRLENPPRVDPAERFTGSADQIRGTHWSCHFPNLLPTFLVSELQCIACNCLSTGKSVQNVLDVLSPAFLEWLRRRRDVLVFIRQAMAAAGLPATAIEWVWNLAGVKEFLAVPFGLEWSRKEAIDVYVSSAIRRHFAVRQYLAKYQVIDPVSEQWFLTHPTVQFFVDNSFLCAEPFREMEEWIREARNRRHDLVNCLQMHGIGASASELKACLANPEIGQFLDNDFARDQLETMVQRMALDQRVSIFKDLHLKTVFETDGQYTRYVFPNIGPLGEFRFNVLEQVEVIFHKQIPARVPPSEAAHNALNILCGPTGKIVSWYRHLESGGRNLVRIISCVTLLLRNNGLYFPSVEELNEPQPRVGLVRFTLGPLIFHLGKLFRGVLSGLATSAHIHSLFKVLRTLSHRQNLLLDLVEQWYGESFQFPNWTPALEAYLVQPMDAGSHSQKDPFSNLCSSLVKHLCTFISPQDKLALARVSRHAGAVICASELL